jgi:hypothetical protein
MLQGIESAILEKANDPNWVIAVAAVVTAVFTIVLGTFTISLARSTRMAANAAVESAKAVTAIEFPIVRSSWFGPELETVDELIGPGAPYASALNDGLPTRFSAISNVEFQNFGRTPAFPLKISMGFTVAKVLPTTPIYTHTLHCSPNTVIKGGETQSIEIHFGFELSKTQINEIKNASAILWFYIRLNYQDVMDRFHDVGCCWHFGQENQADSGFYLFDDGTAPAAYTTKT